MTNELPLPTRQIASLLEAGCVALSFQERTHRVIQVATAAHPGASMSRLLAAPPEARVHLSAELRDALSDLDLAAAAATATSMRGGHPSHPAEFLRSAAESLQRMHPDECRALQGRAERAREAALTKSSMTEIAECVMDSLKACRQLATLAMDNGSPLDADCVIAQYDDAEELYREAEHALCRGFGLARKDIPQAAQELTRIEFCRRLSFLAYDSCYRDGLIQAEGRKRFEQLTERAQILASKITTRGALTLKDALTEHERELHAARAERLKSAGFKNVPPLSGKVFVMAAPLIARSGAPVDNLKLIRQVEEMGTATVNEVLHVLENTPPAVEVAGYLPLYVDPETPSQSLRDALARVVHDASRGAVNAGDVICIARHADRREDGPASMLANREAAELVTALRKAGIVVLLADPKGEERSLVAAACDATASRPKALAEVAKQLLEQHRLEEAAGVRLVNARKAALKA